MEHIINVLKVTPRCTSAGQSKYNGPDLNRMDVHVKVEIDGVWTSIRRSGSAVFDTKLKMAREVRRRVEEIVGKAVVDLAEEQMMSAEESVCAPAQDPTAAAPPPPTEEELEWLASWIDEQPDPSDITHADAEAALLQRRKQHAGAAASARLMEMQVLLAKERAAELRVKRAESELVKARARIPALQAQKRARTTEPSESYYWSEWALEKWKELERKSHDRRSIQLSEDVESRLPAEMPRGTRDGPLLHERHGLVGALQYWASGSKDDAAKLVFSLIKELKLEVSFSLPPTHLPLCSRAWHVYRCHGCRRIWYALSSTSRRRATWRRPLTWGCVCATQLPCSSRVQPRECGANSSQLWPPRHLRALAHATPTA